MFAITKSSTSATFVFYHLFVARSDAFMAVALLIEPVQCCILYLNIVWPPIKHVRYYQGPSGLDFDFPKDTPMFLGSLEARQLLPGNAVFPNGLTAVPPPTSTAGCWECGAAVLDCFAGWPMLSFKDDANEIRLRAR